MTLYLVTLIFVHGSAPVGIFSSLETAKEATEKACNASHPAEYGELQAGLVQTLTLDVVYSGEDEVDTENYFPGISLN